MRPRQMSRRTPRELLASIYKRIQAGRWQEGERERSWPWYYAALAAATDVRPLLDAAPFTNIRRKARRKRIPANG